MLSDRADYTLRRFSTRELPERDRLPKWREEFGRSLLRVDIEPLSGPPFHAEATLRAQPGLRTVDCACSGVRFERTTALAADGDNSISLLVARGGVASQRGRDVSLGAGDAVALLSQEPAIVRVPEGSYYVVTVPRSPLASRVKHIDDAALRLIPRGSEPLRLLMNYLTSLQEDLCLSTLKLRQAVATHVYDLMALALNPDRAPCEDTLSLAAAARLAVILERIARRFDDPELSESAVAQEQRVSVRYLQRLLEISGTSFTARVNELRLQRAFALLTGARSGEQRICHIALEAGFSDISHFNRLFRARFGAPPSDVRAEAPGNQLGTAAPSG